MILIVTFVMGLITAATSLALLIYFQRVKRPIGLAISFMLIGEFCATATTCLFSWSAITGGLPLTSPELASLFRLLAFIIVLMSSVHLTFYIHRKL